MPEWFAYLLIGCGVAVFGASMLYLREHLKFRRERKQWFVWGEDWREESRQTAQGRAEGAPGAPALSSRREA